MSGPEPDSSASGPVPLPNPPELGGLRLEPPIPHPRPFVCELTPTPDQASRAVNHVSNIEYLRWIDRVAELHADAAGFTRRRLLEQGVMWFVARHEIDYLAETVPGDRLLILTWVRDVSRVRSWRDTVILRPADGTVVCRAATLWVLVNLASRRPIRIGRAMIDALEPLTLDDTRRPSGPQPAPPVRG